MNRKALVGVGLGATVIALILLLYFFYPGFLSPPGPAKPKKPETTSVTPPEAKKPETAKPAAPAPQEKPSPPTPQAAVPTGKPATKPKAAPAAPPEKALPPLEPKEGYGLLARSYRGYHSASKLMEKLKKQGQEAFIRRDKGRYQVWVGPFATRQEAQAAAKSLRAKSKISPKIEKFVTPVPK